MVGCTFASTGWIGPLYAPEPEPDESSMSEVSSPRLPDFPAKPEAAGLAPEPEEAAPLPLGLALPLPLGLAVSGQPNAPLPVAAVLPSPQHLQHRSRCEPIAKDLGMQQTAVLIARTDHAATRRNLVS